MDRYGSAHYARRRELRDRRAREERLRSLAGYALFMALLVLAAGLCGGIERGTIHVLGL